MRRLLIRPGAIGDFIVSLPALESLATVGGEVWTAAVNVPLVRFGPKARSIASSGLDWLEIDPARAPEDLPARLREFDSIVSWYGANRSQFREAVARLGLPFVFLDPLPPEGAVHAADFFLSQARALGGNIVNLAPRIPCEPRPAPDVILHPFSGSRRKNWPLEHFRQAAAGLGSRWSVGWTAGPDEPLPGATRFDNLHDLARWLAGARLFIGNDSGIAHLAAAVGVPVIALFGPTDERVWAPRGPFVRVLRPPERGDPLEALPVRAVLETAGEMLRRGKAAD